MIHSILIFTKAQASAFIGGVVDYFFTGVRGVLS